MKPLTIVMILLSLLLLRFYRFPKPIALTQDSSVVRSAAFGRVMQVARQDNHWFIAVFLSPLDVHWQFSPVPGVVKRVQYDRTGRYGLAYDLNKSAQNEKSILTISSEHGDFTVFQIAGVLVRRISVLVREGQRIPVGGTLGLIHFGSRVDVLIPDADNFRVAVSEGDYVSGFHTILGTYAPKLK